jgi:hypothetical protein
VVTVDDQGEVMRIPIDGFDTLDANGLVPAPHGTWLRVTDAYEVVCWLERHGGAAAESTMAWAAEQGCANRVVVDVGVSRACSCCPAGAKTQATTCFRQERTSGSARQTIQLALRCHCH